jgi:Zn-dependent peptidase ImmA (M78 family)
MTPKASNTLPLAEAAKLWTLYGFKSPKELILEELAMAMNIFVVDARLDSAAARLVRKGDFGLIRVSDDLRISGQRRFAIAHEIGHFVMHKKVSQLLACTDSDIRASYRSSPYEIEASIFAGALLMPRELFQNRMLGTVPTTQVIKDLASEFDTSLTATALRYVETSKDYCAFVVSENNKIRWWRASESFSNHNLWLESKNSLPRHSAAAAYFRDSEAPDKPIEVDLEDWFGEMEDIDADFVIEQAIPLPEFNQVISLIWLP